MQIDRIGIVGTGVMGAGIAQVAALAGYQVMLLDIQELASAKALDDIAGSLGKAVAKGTLTQAEKYEALSRIEVSSKPSCMAETNLVIEAIVEKADEKTKIFRELDRICSRDTLIVSNTSSISITCLAAATSRPDRVAGMHFFNPVPAMKLVEIVRGVETSEATVAILKSAAEKMGKAAIVVNKDTPGFIVNRLLLPFLREAFVLYEEGVASPRDIDTAVKYGLNHPMGPFELSDLAGLDIVQAVLAYFHSEFGQSHYSPPIALKRIISAGRIGRKVGRGWYDYK